MKAPREGGFWHALPWVAVAVVLVGLGLVWWHAAQGRAARDATEAAARDVAAAPPPAAAPPRAPAPLPSDLPEPVRRYLEATPYPKSSGRLTSRDVDLLAPNRRHESFRPIPDTLDHDASMVVSSRLTADRYYYESSETVHATLDVRRGDEAIGVRILDATIAREGRAGIEGDPERVHFVSQGARQLLDLPLARHAEHLGPMLLAVRFEYAPGATHEETLRLFVTPESRIPARFTGEFDDRVAGGSLLVEAGVEVEAPGFYRIDANLFERSGRPVGYVIYKGELSRGTAEVPLELYGKVIHDARAEGPLVLRDLRGYRFREGEYPDRELMRDFEGEYVTRGHLVAQYTNAAHVSDHERHMVHLMLEDVARGIPLELPALPTP